jgi:hypothetical protein
VLFVQSRPSDYRRLRCPSSLRVLADFRIWIALLVVCFVSTMHAQSDDFTLVVYPDTQNEAEFYPQVLNAQTQWVVDNRASWNIQAVLGVGDIVNDGASSAQWQNADAAIRLLDNANIPYLMAIGNHDYNGANAGASTRTATGFNQWFGPARYAAYSYYKGNYPTGSNENFYGVLNIGGVNYLFLVLEYIPRAATLTWATSIVRANPDKRIIIITHSNIHSDNTRGDQCDTNDLSKDNDGEETWAALTSQYTNIIMVLSGHITGAGAARRADIAANGNLVNQMLSDYQTYPNGGNGYIRLLKFHPAQNTIDVYTYSPYIKGYKTDSANQFTLNILRPTPAATGTTTISGKVRATRAGGACAVISGATVSYGTYQTTSDASGSYTLNIPSSPVNGVVSASAPGYSQATSTTYAAPGYPGDVPLFMIPIPDYTVTATPTAQSVVQGTSSQPYSVIVTPSGGFTGNVSFSVSGLPAGTTTSFSPNLIVTSGTSQMTVSTTADLHTGTYPLVIKATSGSLSHTTNATINVTDPPDFSIVASPNSQSVLPGATTGAYGVTAGGQNGFSGQVTFSAIGLPAGATANFDANPVASGATANLSVTTTAATQSGTYPRDLDGDECS